MAIQMFPSGYTKPAFGDSMESRFELNPEDIRKLPNRLGQGHYGEVWEAYWINSQTRKRIRVALKTPKDSRIMTKKEFDNQMYSIRKEIEVLAYVGEHEYVLRLIGAVTKNSEHICMVTEFCEFGSLQDFLKDKKLRNLFVDEIVSNQYENHSIDGIPSTMFIAQTLPEWAADFKKRREIGKITTSDLLAFSYQIATGMIFLHEKQVLHRDLALRNILLKGDFTIKIADFGLSRITKGGAYFVGNPEVALPIVSPPEASVGGVVSLKADWWTFGVLLWEIFNLGAEKPFEKSRTRLAMISFLENGNQLNYPKFAPHEIFELMKELWIKDPDDRVGLTECLRKIKMQLKISCPPLVNELMEMDKKIQQHQEEQQHKHQQQEERTTGLTELEALEDHLLSDPSSLQTEIPHNLPPQEFTRPSVVYVNRSKKIQQASRKKRTYCYAIFSGVAVLATIILLIWLFREPISEIPLISANGTNRKAKMNTAMSDCYDWLHSNGNTSNGVYEINPSGSQPFNVYCDMKSNGGGWTVFQRRINSNAFDFMTKTWAEYQEGFGDEEYENFWLGNDKIHILSSKNSSVLLRIDLWGEQSEEYRFGEYNNFQISNSLNNYTLSISNVLLGNATAKNTIGSIMHNIGQPFSTIDRNSQGYCFDSQNRNKCINDKCIKRKKEPCQDYCSGPKNEMGGWWIDPTRDCGYVSLNGKPGKLWDIDASTTRFTPYRSEMKLRRQP